MPSICRPEIITQLYQQLCQLGKGRPLNISGLNSPSSLLDNQQKRQASVKSSIAPLGLSNPQPASVEDKVSLSNAGQTKLSTELGAKAHNNVLIAANSTSSDAEVVDPRSDIEKRIDQLKEDIKALQAKRREFIGDNSEEAELQRKMLDQQIMILNTQLMTLLKMQKDQA